jgi:hypothetical protein
MVPGGLILARQERCRHVSVYLKSGMARNGRSAEHDVLRPGSLPGPFELSPAAQRRADGVETTGAR